MKTKTLIKEQIEQVKNYIAKFPLEFYWDYRDRIEDKKTINKLLDSETNLYDLEMELMEYNIDYIFELEREYCKNLRMEFEFLEDWEDEEILEFFDIAIDMRIDDLLRKTDIVLRVELGSNYEGVRYSEDIENSLYLQEVLPLIEKYIDKKELERELYNMTSLCNVFTFVFRTTLNEVIGIREKIKKAKAIKINSDVIFGLFDGLYGGGGLMEMNLKEDVVIPLKKGCWGKTDYDSVNIFLDDGDNYGFQSVYGTIVDVYGTIEIIN